MTNNINPGSGPRPGSNPRPRKLFKYYLDQYESYETNKQQFLYRLNRNRFDTKLNRNYSFFFSRGVGAGWIMKGMCAYLVYYVLFKKEPFVKRWNREGYHYERAHKTSRPAW
jgi:hypothetical protein